MVHALRVERESINNVARIQRNKTKPASVWQGWMSHSLDSRPVRPDQTKAIKGQDGKTLATAGAIKRPLSCPIEGIEKQSIFSEEKEETEQKEKKKKIRKKTKKKRKKN